MTLRCKGEVSGLGIVDEHDPCKVVDFFIVEQECTSATTEMDQTAVANLIADMRDKGVDPSRWRVWWHSHASMKTFFSGTDEDNVERYASEKALWSVVTNHEDAKRVAAGKSPTEMYIRIDLFDPDHPKNTDSPMRYTIEGCDWYVPASVVVSDEWFAESMEKVGTPKAQKLDIKPAGGYNAWSWQKSYADRNAPSQEHTGTPQQLPRWLAEDDAGNVNMSTDPWGGLRGGMAKDTETLLISHYAIDEFLDEDIINIETAMDLSNRWQSGQLTDAGVYNLLVTSWDKFLSDYRKLGANGSSRILDLRKKWAAVKRTLDDFRCELSEESQEPGPEKPGDARTDTTTLQVKL